MKITTKRYRIFIFCFCLIIISDALHSQNHVLTEKNDSTGEARKEDPYEKFALAGATMDDGLFNVFKLKDEYFFELHDSLLGRDMLLGSRISELSSNSDVVAGEMRRSPVLVRFSRDDKNIYMHQIISDYISDEDDHISISVARNTVPPILNTFEIEAFNRDSTAAVFEVTGFFSNEIPSVSPFSSYRAGRLNRDATFIIDHQAFPENVEIKTQMSYSNSKGNPFLVVMNRSFLLLPEKPMQPRYEDPRIGYFSNVARYFSSDFIGVKNLKYVSRFNIHPKQEDIKDYRAGKLVEPEKPIVFYVDNAFPEEWRPYIKEGVEAWQEAFEAIGFKNAIVARDYPVSDPEFNPDDIRYSCIRYISIPKANSMGPRWIDPRSGEVIGGDVLWWHNVTELLRDWRFVQTAAADPSARKLNPDLDVLGPMMRYVAAHEVGHTLGLKHNMRASYAFPVDSLRSASFTQKHGTTPSIMDYARFNYIAQPGDEGVKFLPPDIGPYDKFAIKWGYQPIFEAGSPEEEKEILNEWILAKSDDISYRYGDQQIGLAFDPASQNEALGDCAMKASDYGIANAKYIMEHLVEWTTDNNGCYENLGHMYKKLVEQYERYVNHVLSYPGGVYIYQMVEGEDRKFHNPVSREKQEEAIAWIFREFENQPEWILNPEVERRIGTRKADLFKLRAEIMDKLMSGVILKRLYLYHDDYTASDYLSDLHAYVWLKTQTSGKLNDYDRHLQTCYVNNLLTIAEMKKGSSNRMAIRDESLKGPNSSNMFFLDTLLKPLLMVEIEKTEKLLKKHMNDSDPLNRAHYRYLYGLMN